MGRTRGCCDVVVKLVLSLEQIQKAEILPVFPEVPGVIVPIRAMFPTSAFKHRVLVVLVMLLFASCSSSDGTSLNIDHTTTTEVYDASETSDDEHGHTHDEPAATYPVIYPARVECHTEFVHAHPAIIDAHIGSEPASECHTHTCETRPHGPDVTYSGDRWPCPIPASTADATTAGPIEIPPSVAGPTTTATDAPTTIDRGASQDLVFAGDDCPGTIMGRFHLGEPSGCRLDDGTVLCLSAPRNSTGEILYNAAEWTVCPDFDPNRPPCPTSFDASGHGWTDRWDHVLTSAEQGSYVRPLWEGTIDLTPGLWFGELCVRNNEGSQLGIVEPQRAYVHMGPQPYCDGLPGFTTEIGSDGPEDHIYSSNGAVELLQSTTGWIGTWLFRCTDRSGPYAYRITLVSAGDWVLRLGKADLPFEMGTYSESIGDVTQWIDDLNARHGASS